MSLIRSAGSVIGSGKNLASAAPARLAAIMDAAELPVPESPATWENVVVGEAKEVLGRAIGSEALVDQGDEQKEIAHEVREEYREERQ